MRKFIYLFLLLVFLPAQSFSSINETHGKSQIVYASYKYVVGDNDTKIEGRRICFMEAKRMCLEKVGTYMESYTEVQNFKLTRDEIRSYAVGFIKPEIVKEEIQFEKENIAIYMTVKAEVDTESIKEIVRAKLLKNKPTEIMGQKKATKLLSSLRPNIVFEKSYTDADIGQDGNIKCFTWANYIKKGDLIEVIGKMPGEVGFDAKEIYIYRGKKFNPRWKTSTNGYYSGVVKNVPRGKSYYIWIEKGKGIEATVRITREVQI